MEKRLYKSNKNKVLCGVFFLFQTRITAECPGKAMRPGGKEVYCTHIRVSKL